VGTLQLQEHLFVSERHDGEIFACAYAPDGQTVLSAGWDGYLRYWNVATGERITALKVSERPLSTCGFTPDGHSWLSGSMEGMLGIWSADTHENMLSFLAHTRPISSLSYSPDGKWLATTSWDRQIMLRKVGKEREGRGLTGHVDIVAGCRFLPGSKQLLSWSYDGTARLWDVDLGREAATLGRHEDRVTAAALAPDGNWAVSASRDGMVKLWDLQERVEAASAKQTEEIRGVFFMLDGQAIVTIDANGWVALLSIPSFELQMDLQTGVKPMCADQAPSGEQFVLGCEEGSLRFVAVEDYSHAPIAVTPSQKIEETSTFFGRLLGKKRRRTRYHYTCPICRHVGQASTLPLEPITCPMCARKLRLLSTTGQLQEK
jgi:WD40 repeat protein